ncbi:MAG: MarR family transcriptional regulator [Oscillospiraceae bacterium]|nr:MarR family transcriptional regulator [Oscillospiraceae bacterium]
MDSILRSYLRVTQHFSHQFRTHFGKMNLTFPQALTLSALADGPMPISKLAERIGSANSTTSGVVDRLERLGLARRVRSSADHRVITVEATAKYRTMRKQTEMDVSEYFESLLSTLSPKEQKTVTEGLRLLDKALAPKE